MSRYIDADTIINEMNKVFFSDEMAEFRINYGSNGVRDYILTYIKHLHPADVKPIIRGELISCENDDLKISNYCCNKCGYYQDDKSNFCPNCGADMRKENTNDIT